MHWALEEGKKLLAKKERSRGNNKNPEETCSLLDKRRSKRILAKRNLYRNLVKRFRKKKAMEKAYMGANEEGTLESLHQWKPQAKCIGKRLQADCGMQTGKALEVFGKIYEKLEKEHLTKEEALQLRTELEASM